LLWDALYSVYEATGRPAEALQTLEQGVAKCPDDVNLRVQLSRLLCTQHRPEDAVTLLQTALQRWPASAPLHAALGFALSNAHKNEAAVAELREAIRLDFTLVDAHYNLAVGLLALGQSAEARAAAEQALTMRPDYIDAMLLLGMIEMQTGDVAAAEPTVNRLFTLRPEDPRVRPLFAGLQMYKGLAAQHAGKLDEAGKFYQTGLEAVPDYVPLLRAAGILAIKQSRFSDAVEIFRNYVRVEPKDPQGCLALGKALQGAGRMPEAREVFERGLHLAEAGGNAAQVEEFRQALNR
jgi:Flp pilus assembly protein TadD